MTKRKQIGKKARFEVFKRDSFTCQYCGNSAPDVVLEVDHIKPVASGGENDTLNLITSCKNCNSGKGARELSDHSVIAKQKAMLKDLNERRLQLEMMLEWREGMADLESVAVRKAVEFFESQTRYFLHDDKYIRTLVKEFGLQKVLAAAETSLDTYLIHGEEGMYTQESVNKAYEYIKRICKTNELTEKKPYMRDLFFIRGILRNRINVTNQSFALSLLEKAHLLGGEIADLRNIAFGAFSWNRWVNDMDELIDYLSGGVE